MLQNPQIHRVLVPLLIMTLNDFKFACGAHLIHNSIEGALGAPLSSPEILT